MELEDWTPTGDAVLDRIGVKPEEFRVEQLLTYFYERFRNHFGYEYPKDYYRDRTCLQNLLTWYREQAVGLIRFIFEQQNGMLQGSVVLTSNFARNCRWKSDAAYNAYRLWLRDSETSEERQAEVRDIVDNWSAK